MSNQPDNFSKKVLKHISSCESKGVSQAAIVDRFGAEKASGALDFLSKHEYVSVTLHHQETNNNWGTYLESIYHIGPLGRRFLEDVPRQRLDRWYPRIVSTLALIVSIIALVKSFFFTGKS